MFIADEIVKHHLKNVYFIGGTDCESKSRLASELALRHDILLYRSYQDASLYGGRGFGQSVEAFFGRKNGASGAKGSELQLIVMDLIKISSDKKVIADIHIPLDEVEEIIDYNRMLIYITNTSELMNEFLHKSYDSDAVDYIRAMKQNSGSRRNAERALREMTDRLIAELRHKNWYWIQNDEVKITDRVLEHAERHFGLI